MQSIMTMKASGGCSKSERGGVVCRAGESRMRGVAAAVRWPGGGGWRERPGQPSPYSHAPEPPSRSLNELETGGGVANALSPILSHATHTVGCLYSQRRLTWNSTY